MRLPLISLCYYPNTRVTSYPPIKRLIIVRASERFISYSRVFHAFNERKTRQFLQLVLCLSRPIRSMLLTSVRVVSEKLSIENSLVDTR